MTIWTHMGTCAESAAARGISAKRDTAELYGGRAEEIWVNEPGRIFAARQGRSELTTTMPMAGEVGDLDEKVLKSLGASGWDLSTRSSTPMRHGDDRQDGPGPIAKRL